MSFHPGVIAGSLRRPAGAGGLPRVSATYWRIYMPVTDGYHSFVIAEIEMRATEGGADQCAGGAPSAFSNSASAASAFDNITGSSWAASTGDGENGWIQYQFASAVEVVELALTAATAIPGGVPRHVLLQYSNDGASWTTLASWLSLDWTGGGTKTLNGANASAALPSGTAIMWRVNVTANNGDGSFTEIAEIEFRSSIGGADQTSPGGLGPFGSSNASSLKDNAFDGTGAAGTPLRFSSPVVPGWIAYAFRDPVAIVEVAITADTAAARAPKDFSLDYSNDGITWTTAFSKSGQTGWTGDETRAFTA